MDPLAYTQLAATEEQGWYYQARLYALRSLINRFIKRPLQLILDFGCGTGGSTKFLSQFGEVRGIEPNPLAVSIFRQKNPGLKIAEGSVEQIPPLLSTEKADLVVILGVLYHRNITNPGDVLKKLALHMNQGSYIIWNEACYEILRREHDRIVHGARRFTPKDMTELLRAAGFEPVFGHHLLSWAFPLAWLLARLDHLKQSLGKRSEEALDHKIPNRFLNSFFYYLTVLEWQLSRIGIKLPFGVSYLIIAKKSS